MFTTQKNKILPKHKIEKLRLNDTLEMMSPAGGWIDTDLMPIWSMGEIADPCYNEPTILLIRIWHI